MRAQCRPWTMAEGALLLQLWGRYPNLGPHNRAIMLEKHFPGRSSHSILGRAERMGLTCNASVRHAREQRHRERARMSQALRLDEHLRLWQSGG